MKPLRPHRLPGLAPALFTALLCCAAGAQQSARSSMDRPSAPHPPAASEPAPPDLEWTAAPAADLLFDAPGDGSLWALGASYKIGFDAAGATFYPAFGPAAPKLYPHLLSPEVASLGGVALEFEREVGATRHDRRVELDRGAFVEVYELAEHELEQSFVFRELPRRGELVLRLPMTSELEGVATADGHAFRGPLGEVRYGRATAIDAAGRRQEAPTRLVGGGLEIRVAADFVAAAELPLVIDPVVGSFSIPHTTEDAHTPDLAWEPFGLVWVAVYERVFSSTDSDVIARMFSATGATIHEAAVDLSSLSWQRPRIASLAVAEQFLCVAEVTSGGAKTVRGRTVEPAGTILVFGSQFTISDGSTGNKLAPDVGGDPYLTAPSYYCVAYQQDFSSTDKRVAVRLVLPDGTLLGAAPTYLSPSGVLDQTPSVSNSNRSAEWLIAWMRDDPFSFGDIWAAYVDWDGSWNGTTFLVSGGPSLDAAPCASTRLATSDLTAIAFQRLIITGQTADVRVSLLSDTSVLHTASLHSLEGTGTGGQKQIEPSIDSNGAHFLVGYSEFNTVFGHDELFVTDLFASGDQLGVSQAHVTLHLWGFPQRRARVAAQHSTIVDTHRFGILYDIAPGLPERDVVGSLFDVVDGGTWSPFCPGDGTGVPCPCNNSGGAGRGCANSASASGALLTLNGTPSTVADTAVLQATGLPNNASCLFFQGTVANAGMPFGDGVRCTGGTVIRLAVKVATGGTASFPQGADPAVSVKGQLLLDGGLRTYQLWYRDTASFCTPSTFNLSNGVQVRWAR